jgi:hypothetical protein
MVQKDAFSCGPDPSILDNRSVRGGSRDPLKSIKNLTVPRSIFPTITDRWTAGDFFFKKEVQNAVGFSLFKRSFRHASQMPTPGDKFHRGVFNKCPIFDRGFHKRSSQRVPIR